MRRIVVLLTSLVVSVLLAGPALASGDFGCASAWKLDQPIYSDCDNLPFLSPGNDSRVNLQLLLIDAGKATIESPAKPDPTAPTAFSSASPFTLEAFSAVVGPRAPAEPTDASSTYASGEGSRCRSNSDGASAFKAALDDSHALPAAERDALSSARQALAPTCEDTQTPPAASPPAGVHSALGLQFAGYLVGAAAFYQADYDGARKHFLALKTSRQPWLRETSRYMLGRVALNAAQAAAFDEYGQLSSDKVDAAALKEAEAAFRAYLHDYPRGSYVASATGLLRRVDWLGSRPRELAAAYAAEFARADPDRRNVSTTELVQEVDNKLLTKARPADVKEAMLLATLDLMAMRRPDDPKKPPALTFEGLSAQQSVFARDPDLFGYLLAAHRYYVEHDPAGALSYLGAAAPAGP